MQAGIFHFKLGRLMSKFNILLHDQLLFDLIIFNPRNISRPKARSRVSRQLEQLIQG
jgi:hypothetical protein